MNLTQWIYIQNVYIRVGTHNAVKIILYYSPVEYTVAFPVNIFYSGTFKLNKNTIH